MQNKSTQKSKVTIDNLAIMIARGFERLEAKIDTKSDKQDLIELEERLSSKVYGINNRMDDLAEGRAKKDDLYRLSLRVSEVEKRLA